jgi:hypothetical protein
MATVGTSTPGVAMGQRGDQGSITFHDASISVWEKDVASGTIAYKGKLLSPMQVLCREVAQRLRARGFKMYPHPINPKSGDWLAAKHPSGLEVHIEGTGRAWKCDFFQNITHDHLHGGQYDTRRFRRLAEVGLRQRCLIEMAAVVRRLAEYGYPIEHKAGWHSEARVKIPVPSEPLELLRYLRDAMEERFPTDPRSASAGSWHNAPDGWYRGRKRTDPQGRPLEPGDVRYVMSNEMGWPFRKRLLVGHVYPDINESWQVWVRSSHPLAGDQPSWTHVARVHWNQILPDPVGPVPRSERRWRMHPVQQMERLKQELKRATAKHAWLRVAALGKALDRQQRLLDTLKSRLVGDPS